jgi:hypothetical protein
LLSFISNNASASARNRINSPQAAVTHPPGRGDELPGVSLSR